MNKRNLKREVNKVARELKEKLGLDKYDIDEIKWALDGMFLDGYNLAWKEVNKEINMAIKRDKSPENKKAIKLAERLVKHG